MEKEKEKKERKPLITRFSQFIVMFCLVYGLLLTTVSYVFSALGYEPLVDLSTTIINTIVAPTTIWLLQNCISNVFEKNKLSFSTPLARLEQEDLIEKESQDENIYQIKQNDSNE